MKFRKITAFLLSLSALSAGFIGGQAHAEEFLRGDANLDNTVNIRDCAYIARQLAMGKGSELPGNADYNLDGKENVSDAANLARALSINCVQTYKSRSVIDEVENGMTEEEVFEIVGTDWLFDYESAFDPGSRTYVYNVDSIPELGVNIPSQLHLNFNSKKQLFNYGYHIGRTGTSSTDTSYPCDEKTLRECYEKLLELFKSFHGNGSTLKNSAYYRTGDQHIWAETDFGELWMIYGMDLWGEKSGINEILISCYSHELAIDRLS